MTRHGSGGAVTRHGRRPLFFAADAEGSVNGLSHFQQILSEVGTAYYIMQCSQNGQNMVTETQGSELSSVKLLTSTELLGALDSKY